jgi:hypothetical protein
MALTEAQKNAEKRYYEKNRERLLAYKRKHWQMNKHKYNRSKTSPVSNDESSMTSKPVATSD